MQRTGLIDWWRSEVRVTLIRTSIGFRPYFYGPILSGMYIEQLYHREFSQWSYYLESGGVAAVVDPMRDVKPYLVLAAERQSHIQYIFETHLHADFVSGHNELSEATGAEIVFGPETTARFKFHRATDGEEFSIGNATIRVLHTPGHTPESTCYLLLDEQGIPHSVFTGDTLFLDEVGRPDIVNMSHKNISSAAGTLYESLHYKLLKLPGYVVVYPGHGAGSLCGRMIGEGRHTTIGFQKQSNYALRAENRESFIKMVTDGLSTLPSFFMYNTALNRNGVEPLESLLRNALKPLRNDEIGREFITLVDTRSGYDFSFGFVRGSLFTGSGGDFILPVINFIPAGHRVVVVTDRSHEREAVITLISAGVENIAGVVHFENMITKRDSVKSISARQLEVVMQTEVCGILDIRPRHERVSGFVEGALAIPLQELPDRVFELDESLPWYVYCNENNRSLAAVAFLKTKGFRTVFQVRDGITAIRKSGIPLVQVTKPD